MAGGLGVLGPVLTQGGRPGWAAPLLCLPLAVVVGRAWRSLGDLPRRLSRGLAALYYLWALALLAVSAREYLARLLVTIPGDSPWLFLAAAAGLALWLARGDGYVTLRAGGLLFGVAAAVLAVAVALSLPGLRLENLWPPEGATLPDLLRGTVFCAALAGYGVYGLCLPRGAGRVWPWAVSLCGLVSGLLFALVGSFGPVLAAGRPQPVLLLLEGVQVPGVFRHGEAALEGGLALADLGLMAVLTYGCKALWGRALPAAPAWAGLVLPVGALLCGGLLSGEPSQMLSGILIAGNLLTGILCPGLQLFLHRRERGGEGADKI